MYRITTYNQNDKMVDEVEDELREVVDAALDDLERKAIKTFSVSWISSGRAYEKPFWEKGN
jgi:hypothetical protein